MAVKSDVGGTRSAATTAARRRTAARLASTARHVLLETFVASRALTARTTSATASEWLAVVCTATTATHRRLAAVRTETTATHRRLASLVLLPNFCTATNRRLAVLVLLAVTAAPHRRLAASLHT